LCKKFNYLSNSAKFLIRRCPESCLLQRTCSFTCFRRLAGACIWRALSHHVQFHWPEKYSSNQSESSVQHFSHSSIFVNFSEYHPPPSTVTDTIYHLHSVSAWVILILEVFPMQCIWIISSAPGSSASSSIC